jgi:hypothetical protein
MSSKKTTKLFLNKTFSTEDIDKKFWETVEKEKQYHQINLLGKSDAKRKNKSSHSW